MAIGTPQYYSDSLKTLEQRYYIILENFREAYPYAKTYPDDVDYINNFEFQESNLQEVQKDLFELNNNLEKNIRQLEKNINLTNKKISAVDKENKFLKKRIFGVSGSKDAAMGMFDDIQLRYNQYLLGNVIFFILLIGISATFYKKQE